MARGTFSRFLLPFGFLLICNPVSLAQQQLGRIVGQAMVARGDFPAHSLLIELKLRGSTISSIYADNQGRFGFYDLASNAYRVQINDEAYYPVDEVVDVNPVVSPTAFVRVMLVPRPDAKQPM